jgi:hypothetical protein
MDRERIRHTKSGALRIGSRRKLAGRPGPDHDLGARLGTVKRPREQESGADLHPEMVRFLRDGACKR